MEKNSKFLTHVYFERVGWSLMRMSGVKQPTTEGFWECRRCTFLNDNKCLSCVCCGTNKQRVVPEKNEIMDGAKPVCRKRKTKTTPMSTPPQPGKKSKRTPQQRNVSIYLFMLHIYIYNMYFVFNLH